MTPVFRTVALATVASLSLAAPGLAQPGGALPTPQFISAAASTDEFERQEGRMAERQAGSPQVRSFGQMMVRDHTNTTMALKLAIRRAGLPPPPPPQLTPDQQSNVSALKGLRGRDFDRTYLQQQIQAHQTALGVMQAYAAGGDNRTLRKAAASTVPIVKRHLAMAQKIGR
jgi:putative membrane protein